MGQGPGLWGSFFPSLSSHRGTLINGITKREEEKNESIMPLFDWTVDFGKVLCNIYIFYFITFLRYLVVFEL